MPLTEEEKKKRQRISERKWYEKNKEKRSKYNKKWYEKNKEKQREYQEIHKEEIKEQKKEYRQTPAGKKAQTLSSWKKRGLKCEDYDSLYCRFINSENCEECEVVYGEKGDGTGTFRCMDHDHTTGLFRNFLCCKCNLARG